MGLSFNGGVGIEELNDPQIFEKVLGVGF